MTDMTDRDCALLLLGALVAAKPDIDIARPRNGAQRVIDIAEGHLFPPQDEATRGFADPVAMPPSARTERQP